MNYFNILKFIELELFGLSCLLFCIGLILSYYIYKKQIKIFLFYPLWIWKLIKKYLKPESHFLKIFFMIFCLNSISLLGNLFSGFFIILPYIFAILLGINLGVILQKETGVLNFLTIFLNPVSFFELPAAWISLSLGMKIALSLYPKFIFSHAIEIFIKSFNVYFFVIIPLLIISGIIETILIKMLTTLQA